jgi:hypothetical protein
MYATAVTMREIIPEFHTRMVRFRNGERFPVVLDRRGLPLCEPVFYAISP